MSRTTSSLAALVVGVVVLIAAAWFDSVLMVDAQRQAARQFDSSWLAGMYALGSIAVGGACLLIGWVGWRAHALVGLLYAIVGGFFAVLLWTFVVPAGSHNDVPPLLPDQIVAAIARIVRWTQGPLNAVGTIGGAMLIVGIVAIVRSWRRRDLAASANLMAPEPARP